MKLLARPRSGRGRFNSARAMQTKRTIFPNRVLPYFLLAPQLAITLIFFLWPAFQAFRQSFLREDPFGMKTTFVWFEQLHQALRQRRLSAMRCG